jgi:hypothetical protein
MRIRFAEFSDSLIAPTNPSRELLVPRGQAIAQMNFNSLVFEASGLSVRQAETCPTQNYSLGSPYHV